MRVKEFDQPPDADAATEFPFVNCIGGSFLSRCSSIASKSTVKLAVIRIPGHLGEAAGSGDVG
jgi:hypothetical protein